MKIPSDTKIYDWQESLMWIDSDGVVYTQSKTDQQNYTPTRKETMERLEEFKRIVGNTKVCFIIETNSTRKPPNKDDRDFAEELLNDLVKAMAIIALSPLSRMLANLYFGFKPPKYPVQFFSNETEAKEWIKQYL